MSKNAFLILLSLLIPACSSGPSAITETCEQLDEVAAMTYDCPAMATKLEKYTKRLNEQINSIGTQSPESQQQYIQALSPCIQALYEIRFGACKTDPGVQKAFAEFKVNNP